MALPMRVLRSDSTPDAFDQVRREIDAALAHWFGGAVDVPGPEQASAACRVDVSEDADHLYVTADLPGFKRDEIDVSLDGRTLAIAAEHREEAEHHEPKAHHGGAERPKREYLLREREFRRFRRSFTLPTAVDEQKVRARSEDGVLEITLDKSPAAKPRKIELQ